MAEDYYSILGVNKTATSGEIRSAYLVKAKDHHPDRFSDPAEREDAGRRFQQITEAFNHLRDDKLRREYDKTLERKERPPDEEAKLYYKNGQLQEQSGEYVNALKYYYEAMRLQPDKLEYMLAAARVLERDKSKMRQAANLMTEAISKHPASPEPHMELGAIYLRSGMFLRARRTLENALQKFPGHAEIEQRLADVAAAEKSRPPRGR
jgi:curved DNA-binding protein CbpA